MASSAYWERAVIEELQAIRAAIELVAVALRPPAPPEPPFPPPDAAVDEPVPPIEHGRD